MRVCADSDAAKIGRRDTYAAILAAGGVATTIEDSAVAGVEANMPCRGSVFIAISLDGFIAKPDGSVDWLNELRGTMPEGDDCGFAEFMAEVDAVVIGRKTFESVRSFVEAGIPWPYGNKLVLVLSRRPGDVKVPLALETENIQVLSGSPLDILATLSANVGAQDVYVDGGSTIRGFMKAGVIRRAIVTKVPVTLGDGIPLFTPKQWAALEQEGSEKTWPNGFSQRRYKMPVTFADGIPLGTPTQWATDGETQMLIDFAEWQAIQRAS